MGHRGQGAPAPKEDDPAGGREKKTSGGVLGQFDELWGAGRGAFSQKRLFERARTLALSGLVCLGRRTVTGLIGASGRQFGDWSADYRLFSRQGRFDPEALFGVVRGGLVGELSQDEPLVVAIDDSHLPKTGTRTAGVGWRRDSHKPPFMTSFIRAQRVLQISAALPDAGGPAGARMIPVDFCHAPTPKKPRKGSPPQAWESYRAQAKEANIGRLGAERLRGLRTALDSKEQGQRSLVVTADGRFTNGTVLRSLPERTTLVGRVRKDTRLYHLPAETAAVHRGRKPSYGGVAATPEQLCRDASVPWEKTVVWAAGRVHECRIKTLSPLRWRAAGARDLRLVVIAPLAYRPRKGARLLYRDPAYLISTDLNLPVGDIVQAYVWRWDIEVNFRDEKHLLGVGQAQVTVAPSVERVPQLIVAAYAMLLLAARRTFGTRGVPDLLPSPKWRRHSVPRRASTQSLINHLRAELWGQALGVENFSGFTSVPPSDQKPEKLLPDLSSAVLYAA